MNLPNKLTMLRILLIPIFVLVFYLPFLNLEFELINNTFILANIIGIVIFSIAAFTDFLDGSIARKYNLVTTFGKFIDPLADKLLVASALLLLIEIKLLPAYVAIIIISREFMVTGIRTLAISEGKVIAASSLGKAKTVSQFIMIIVLLLLNIKAESLFDNMNGLNIIVLILMTVATLLTVISGLDYLLKNKNIIFESK